MTKKYLNWFKVNSDALQGIAAVMGIVLLFIAGWSYLSDKLSPEIAVRINIDESTLPQDLIDFTENSARVSWDADKLLENNDSESLTKLINSPVLKKIDESRLSLDKARIEIINNSEEVITGVRLRLDGVYTLWGIEVDGTFLNRVEADELREKFENIHSDSSVILPELPPLPAKSSLTFLVYGSLGRVDPILTSSGYRSTTTKIVEVESGFWIWAYQNTFIVLWFLPMFFFLLWLLGIIVWTKLRQSVVEKSKKDTLYNASCALAIDGHADGAMALLKEAIKSGYSNKQHALLDTDLKSIHDRDDFIELFKETS